MFGESFLNLVSKKILKKAQDDEAPSNKEDSSDSEEVEDKGEGDVSKDIKKIQEDNKDLKQIINDVSKKIDDITPKKTLPSGDYNNTINQSAKMSDSKIIKAVLSKEARLKIFDGLENIASNLDKYDKKSAKELDKIVDVLSNYI